MIILGAIFLTGIAMNLQYAFNDYGIKTNNLHTFVFATGTESGTEPATGTWSESMKQVYCSVAGKVPCDYSTNSGYILLKQYLSDIPYYSGEGYTNQTFCDNTCVHDVYFPKGEWACCSNKNN